MLRRRRQGQRARTILCIILLLLVGLFAVARLRLYPMVRDLAVMRVTNKTGNLINDAVDEQLKRGVVDYGSMVLLEKDLDGKVTALKTNISEINRLKTQILDTVNQKIMDLEVEEIGVPLGSLLLPALFSGRGPLLPVRVLSVRSSNASFQNRFSQAGINQTLHQIVMDVQIQMTIITPVGTELVDTSSQVVVAETVIVGTVPESYLALETQKIGEDYGRKD